MRLLSSIARLALESPGFRMPAEHFMSRRRSRRLGFELRLTRSDSAWRYEVDGFRLDPSQHGWHNPRDWHDQALEVFFYDYTPRPGDTIVDIGAGIGTEMYSYLKLLSQRGAIYVVEAHPDTFRRLTSLLELNERWTRGCTVSADCLAITSTAGVVRISDSTDHQGVGNALVQSGGRETVSSTLDDYVLGKSIEKIDFLKMNIEGAETDALRGASHALSVTKHGAVSCHDFKADRLHDDFFRTKESVRGLLDAAGFRVKERPYAADPWTRDYLYFSRV